MARDADAISESPHHLPGVLDLWCRGEAMPDQRPPRLEILRAAKIDRVVFNRLPSNEEAIAVRLLGRALQFHTLAALGTLEDGCRLRHPGFEFRFEAGLHVDLGNFENHR